MRYPLVLLLSSLLFACGKTGALYLPEEVAEPESAPAAPQVEQAPEPEPETGPEPAGTQN